MILPKRTNKSEHRPFFEIVPSHQVNLARQHVVEANGHLSLVCDYSSVLNPVNFDLQKNKTPQIDRMENSRAGYVSYVTRLASSWIISLGITLLNALLRVSSQVIWIEDEKINNQDQNYDKFIT